MASTTQAMAGPSGSYQTNPKRPWLEDQTAPLFVGVAVTACTIVGAGIGATIGMGRDNPFKTSASMGGRWMVASSVFFGCREYLVTPLLTHYELTTIHTKMNRQLSLKQLGKLPRSTVEQELAYTRWQTRTQRVVDSGLAGGIVGGGGMWIIGGRSRIVKGGFTALVCAAVLQFSANSLRMARADLFDPPSAPSPTTNPDHPPDTSLRLDQPTVAVVQPDQVETVKESRWNRFADHSFATFKRWFPIKHYNPDELLVRWEDRKVSLERKLKRIEEEELKLYEKVQELQLEQEPEQGQGLEHERKV